ncbi:heterogeneous nuclear ribonucleoprotein A1 [Halyomorpha halys]|uniref:heterogeneous nuclear ribonucleoprotein A1 n=1 Tax=Halyomorpha halys TaxID=286706 RepID=UPI0006D51467|nr:glycine-rich cell wall structural protein 2-like [Halyomorpha halys]
MKSAFVLSLFFAGCLCTQWGGQAGGAGGAGGGQWGAQGGGRSGRGAWGQGGGATGARSAGSWGQGGGSSGGWGQQDRSGRSPDGQQYGATIIDTPDQYGYEANIPGAHSKFVGYRSGRSGGAGAGQQAGGSGGWGQQGGRQQQW